MKSIKINVRNTNQIIRNLNKDTLYNLSHENAEKNEPKLEDFEVKALTIDSPS